MQATPGTFQFLEILVVHDLVDLFGQLLIERGDHRFDGLDDVRADQRGLGKCLFGQRAHRVFDCTAGFIGLGFEFLAKQRLEFVAFDCLACGLVFGLCLGVSHAELLDCEYGLWDGGGVGGRKDVVCGRHSAGVSSGLGAAARVCSSAGSCSTLAMSSSAPVFPSM